MNIGELMVRINADPSGIKQGAGQAESSLGGLEKVVKRVGIALAGAFAAKKVLDFGRESISTFAEAEAIWSNLAGTIEATGESFDAVSGQIEGAAAEMQRLTTIGDEDFARAMSRLVPLTGDVNKSLGMMSTAADLAAARGIDVADAAEMLGRAFAGNTMQLERMYPQLKGSTDLMGDLQDVIGGMAEREAGTLQGRLAQLNNAWGDFKEAIGGAIAGGNGMAGMAEMLTGHVQRLTQWVEDNRDTVIAWRDAFVGFFGYVFREIGKFINDLVKIYNWVNKVLSRLKLVSPAAAQSFGDAGDAAVVAGDKVRERLEIPVIDTTNRTKDLNRELSKTKNLIAAMSRLKVAGITSGAAGATMIGGQTVDLSALQRTVEQFKRNAETARLLNLNMVEVKRTTQKLPSVFDQLRVNVMDVKGAFRGFKEGILGMIRNFDPWSIALNAGFQLLTRTVGNFFTRLFSRGGGVDSMDRASHRAAAALDRLRDAASNIPDLFDLRAAQHTASGRNGDITTSARTGGGGTTVVINNPPAGMDVNAVAQQVTRAIVQQARLGGVPELGLALNGRGY